MVFGCVGSPWPVAAPTASGLRRYGPPHDPLLGLQGPLFPTFQHFPFAAKESCEKAGNLSVNHFVQLDEMVDIGSGARRKRDNVVLSKYACYLIAMNGDPSKPEIAAGRSAIEQGIERAAS